MNRQKLLGSLPNLITIGRLILVPVILELIADRRWPEACAMFVVAGLSDAADGLLAKRFGLVTELGAHLDPIADKALLVSIYIALALTHVIPNWLAILVVSRDIMIVGAILVAFVLHRPVTIAPLFVSKANTTAQIAFAAAVLGAKAFDVDLELAAWFLPAVIAVTALTIVSAAAYLAAWLDHLGG